jgi:zinc protease
MSRRLAPLAPLALTLACAMPLAVSLGALWAPPAEAAKITPATVRAEPPPLPTRPLVLPEAQVGRLPNGVEVHVVSNHEVPLFELRLVLPSGTGTDPVGREGLVSATFDLMDDGAAGQTSAQLARRASALGGSVGAGAGLHGASVSVSGPTDQLGPLLDLWADVLLRPDFPEDQWALQRGLRIAEIEADRTRPESMAGRTARALLWGDTYAARRATPDTYRAIDAAALRTAWSERVVPAGAMILVGGDLTLDEAMAALTPRLGTWTQTGPTFAPVVGAPRPLEPGVLHLVDKPGAAQTVLMAISTVNQPADADWFSLMMGNTALGGAFTARINMNLREDKGYTYGARCGISINRGPATWQCSANVATLVTAPALVELRREIDEARTTRPITADEITFFQSYRLNAFKGGFEMPSALLEELTTQRLLGLPSDWMQRYVPGVEAVTPEAATEALRAWVTPDRIAYVLVGDKSTILPDLSALGLPIVEHDADGLPLEPQ